MNSGFKKFSYAERLRKLSLTTMETRFLRNDLILVYKILTGKVDIDPGIFFVENWNTNLRGHKFKLTKSKFHLTRTAHSFSRRIINCWNSLPDWVINAETLCDFKKELQQVQPFNSSGIMAYAASGQAKLIIYLRFFQDDVMHGPQGI